jgi:hypothetical protein
MMVRRLEIKATRWPWQTGYNWRGMTSCSAPLNADGARFGGGWKYKCGFSTAGWSETGIGISFDLIFGIINIRYRTRRGIEKELRWQEDAKRRRLDREYRERQEAERAADARERDRIRAEREATRRAALTPEERQAEDELPF